MLMEWVNILSGAAIIIFIVSALPQIGKLMKNKTARDISLGMSLLIALGNLLGFIRAAAISDFFFLVNYAFQLALWLVIVVLILKYRRNGAGQA